MSKEIYISTTPHETRLAIVEDEQLAEIYYERENEYTLAGSIYNGKVTRVLPGMQSSFVDIGLERDAFLYVTDFMEEQGDAADFETDGSRRPAPLQVSREGQRETTGVPQREGERRGRGDRDRTERDRGERDRSERDRGGRGTRDQSRTAPEPAQETQIFDEPIAPRLSEESAAPDLENEAALDGQGSRRWRGRRGRRRGRGTREGTPVGDTELATGTYTDQVQPGLPNVDDESVSLQGAAADGSPAEEHGRAIEIDLGEEPRSAEYPGARAQPVRRNDGKRENSRRGRGDDRRDRGGRGARDSRRDDRDGVAGSRYRSDSVEESGSVAEEGLRPEAIVLPGESIRKYRDPGEVAAEESARQASAPRSLEGAASSSASIEIVGWDGGATLPGESLSRHRRSGEREASRADQNERGQTAGRTESTERVESPEPNERYTRRNRPDGSNYVDRTASLKPIDRMAQGSVSGLVPVSQAWDNAESLSQLEAGREVAPTPIPDVESIAAAAAPDETGGLTQHPAHAHERAALNRVETAEYEPVEGESASLGDASRRDYRRLQQRPEDNEPSLEGASGQARNEASATDPEDLASTPDATTYDLSATGAIGADRVAEGEHVGGESSSTETSVEDSVAGDHAFTTLQAGGEMLSEVSRGHEEAYIDLPPLQDNDGLPEVLSQEPAVQAVLLQDAETLPEPVNRSSVLSAEAEAVSQVHAYGDGDLHEEEVDGDEYEYDVAVASIDDEEFEEYEEETLEGTAAYDAVLQELSLDDDSADEIGDEDIADEAAEPGAGGFSVEDFGGEPDEALPAAGVEPGSGDERRARREGGRDSRRGGRDRERRGGGFRGGAGADRGNGRGRGRQSVQTMDLPAINELLKPGQEILLQIAKEPIAKKGARVTSHIALPGRFLVFMPTVNHTGVSRKISSDEERRRLKTILLSEKGDAQGGFIVRTAADGASEEELRNDLRFLIQLWTDIKTRSDSSKSPALIYHDLSLIERILRDQVTDNFSAIWVDTEVEYERVLRFLQRFQPSLVRRVKLYTKETPLFEHFGVTQEIDKALKSKVWLKSGGSIVINQTEALVAIDINTGKYVGKTARLEDTILKTNLDAIPEIVRQIRLRDLGGIIVIDFIDMDERKNRAKVMQVLEDELKHDRAPSKVLPFNDFGLVIMTRKRVKQSLERTLCIPDPITEGTGMIKSPITVANEIYIEMRKMYRHFEKSDVMLRVHPEVVKQLKASGGKRLQELEEMTKKTILVKSDPAINPEQFDIH